MEGQHYAITEMTLRSISMWVTGILVTILDVLTLFFEEMWSLNFVLLLVLCLFMHEVMSVSETKQEQRTILKFLTKYGATPMDCCRGSMMLWG